jgi:hypothetical protein
MKCSNPDCSRGIGLVSQQRSFLDKRRFCSKKCRDNFAKESPKRLQMERRTTSYFEWLLSRPTACPCAGTHSLRYSYR